jgi:hypothetical protein
VKRLPLLVPRLALSGCGADYQGRQWCMSSVGVDPATGWPAFGLMGAIIIADDTVHQQQEHEVDACAKAKVATEAPQ